MFLIRSRRTFGRTRPAETPIHTIHCPTSASSSPGSHGGSSFVGVRTRIASARRCLLFPRSRPVLLVMFRSLAPTGLTVNLSTLTAFMSRRGATRCRTSPFAYTPSPTPPARCCVSGVAPMIGLSPSRLLFAGSLARVRWRSAQGRPPLRLPLFVRILRVVPCICVGWARSLRLVLPALLRPIRSLRRWLPMLRAW